jgi:hypothetical protein
MIALKEKLSLSGLSITMVSKATNVHKAQVSLFVNGNFKRCLKTTRKILRTYFIEQGILPKPKPRKPPVCRRCGLEYPTRRVNATLPELQNQATQKS